MMGRSPKRIAEGNGRGLGVGTRGEGVGRGGEGVGRGDWARGLTEG